MSEPFSEKNFLINLISELTKSEALNKEQPRLVKLANSYRDYLIKTELTEQLNRVRRLEGDLKVNLLQCIRSDQWTESARLTAEISEVTAKKAELAAKINELTG